MNLHVRQWLASLRQLLIRKLRPGRTPEELMEVIRRAEAVHSDEQRNLLVQMMAFHDMRIREIMVSRSEIHALSAEASLADAENALIEAGVNRMPVIEGDLDHVLGIIHLRDVIAERRKPQPLPLAALLRPCLFASELEQVSGLLAEMKDKSCHFAMIQDEYGGIAGLVTLTDLVREIVGEIGESGQVEEGECRAESDGSYIVQARMHIDEFSEATGCRIPDGDYDTVAGWLTTRLGRIPHAGETVEVDRHRIQVLQADPRRVIRLRIRPAAGTKEA